MRANFIRDEPIASNAFASALSTSSASASRFRNRRTSATRPGDGYFGCGDSSRPTNHFSIAAFSASSIAAPYAGRLSVTTLSLAAHSQCFAQASISSRRRASASDRR